MTDSRDPVEQVLDLLVYAPVGLALMARDELPKLIERGRSQVQAQATMARLVGQFAVHQGKREAEKLARRAGARVARPPRSRPQPQPQPRPAPAAAPTRTPSPAPSSPVAGNGARPSAAGLAIPGYDALAASQVVPRLAGLSAEELEAVRAYEAATRHRKTILSRIEQLRSGPTP
jgi:hypothetical protein